MSKPISMSDFCKIVGKTEEQIRNGYLDLKGCTGITSLPENLTVGGDLYLKGCTGITSLPENLTVGGCLDLKGCTGITSLPENLTVGGYLYLKGCTGITSLPENLTVGGYLYLEGCTGITSLPENLTVGGYLYLKGIHLQNSVVNNVIPADIKRKIHALRNMAVEWSWSGRKYIKVDGIFSVVDAHHGKVWHVHQLGSNKQMYIVTDGEYHYAHGETIEEARHDLVYKICDRDKSEYENLTPDSELTYGEAVECYRVITGACSTGTRHFCEDILPEKDKREKYTIREIIELTQGQYKSEIFKDFFSKR